MSSASRCTGIAALCTLALLGGCAASGSPAWDAQFGSSIRRLNAQQTGDPDAAGRETAQAMDGRSAREARDRYIESFTAPPAATIINIGLGGNTR